MQSEEYRDFGERFCDTFPLARILQLLYSQSIIEQNDYYETCAKISYYMGNSQRDIDNLEFYVYMNLGIYLANIIEAENNASKGDTGDKDGMIADYKQKMNNMKSNFGSLSKTPKLK